MRLSRIASTFTEPSAFNSGSGSSKPSSRIHSVKSVAISSSVLFGSSAGALSSFAVTVSVVFSSTLLLLFASACAAVLSDSRI